MPKTLGKITELVRSQNIGSVIVTGANLIPRYLSGSPGQVLKVQPDGLLLFENEGTISLSPDTNNDLSNASGLFLDVSQSPVIDTSGITGTSGSVTPLQSLLDGIASNSFAPSLQQVVDQGNTSNNRIDFSSSVVGSAFTAISITNTSDSKSLEINNEGLTTSNNNGNLLLDVTDGDFGQSNILSFLSTKLGIRTETPLLSGIVLNTRISALDPINDQDLVTKSYADANYSGGGVGLPTPTVLGSKLSNIGGSYVEVLEKTERFLGSAATLTDGDNNRVITLPEAHLTETQGFLKRIRVQGQERELTDDYNVVSATQIEFLFPVNDTDIIHITYNIAI